MPTFKLLRGSWGPTFKFWSRSFSPTFKLWGGSRVLGSWGPGPIFTPCQICMTGAVVNILKFQIQRETSEYRNEITPGKKL